jgi:dihydrofolate reductase
MAKNVSFEAPLLPLVHVVAVGRNGVIGDEERSSLAFAQRSQAFQGHHHGQADAHGAQDLRHHRQAVARDVKPLFSPAMRASPRRASSPRVILIRRSRLPVNGAAPWARLRVIVAGGGELYRQTLARAVRLDVTEVDLAPEGDATYPAVDPAQWREVSRTPHPRGEKDDASFTVVVYERR